MAICRTGNLVSSVSGKLGSVVFFQGKRAGVIGRAPKRFTPGGDDNEMRHRALINSIRGWSLTSDEMKLAWERFAATLPWSNRLGEKKRLTGYQAFISYALKTLPEEGYPFGPWLVPRILSIPVHTITDISFTHDGTCTTTIPHPGESAIYYWLSITRENPYGSRNTRNFTRYIGPGWSILSDVFDWEPQITARGITLNEGENITLKIYFGGQGFWPSQTVEYKTIVA